LVLVGDESALAATAEEARRCAGVGGAAAVAVVGLDFEGCDEAAAGAALERAWRCFGDGLDALVNCCSYEGIN
jgi:NAD(P)-dependent dehydrogenase (short-subunit alcohol dehydrogenase family)